MLLFGTGITPGGGTVVIRHGGGKMAITAGEPGTLLNSEAGLDLEVALSPIVPTFRHPT
jgi:hypothetical protein